jgi:hypothetical protein
LLHLCAAFRGYRGALKANGYGSTFIVTGKLDEIALIDQLGLPWNRLEKLNGPWKESLLWFDLSLSQRLASYNHGPKSSNG